MTGKEKITTNIVSNLSELSNSALEAMLIIHKVKTTTHVEWEASYFQYLFIDDENATEDNLWIM